MHRDQRDRPRAVTTLPGPKVQAADNTMSAALAEALSHIDHLEDADAAVVRLAERYAVAIDWSDDPTEALATFGPKLRLVLESLGASPRARAALKAGEKGTNAGSGRLAALRAARSS